MASTVAKDDNSVDYGNTTSLVYRARIGPTDDDGGSVIPLE